MTAISDVKTNDRSRQRRIVVGIVALAAMLRFLGLTSESLWYDEAYSVWSSSMDIGSLRVLWEWRIEFSLYYLILHYWIRIFGNSEYAVRALSAIIGSLTIIPFFYMGKRLFDYHTGIIAIILLAFNPYHIWYSQEVRSYILAICFVIISSYAFWRIIHGSSWGWWVVYVGVTGLTFHLHYYIGWLVLAENVFYLVVLIGRGKGTVGIPSPPKVGYWILAQLLIATIALPAAAIFSHMLVDRNQWGWMPERYGSPDIHQVATLLLSYTTGTLFPGPRILVWAALFLFLIVAMYGVLAYLWRSHQTNKPLAPIIFLLLDLFIPIGLCFIIGQFFTVWVYRYFILFLPFYLILVSLGLRSLPTAALRSGVMVLLIAISAYALFAMYTTPQREDWRGVAAYLESRVAERDLIVLMDDECRVPLDYYYERQGTRIEVSRFADDVAIAAAVAEVERQLSGQRVWLIVSHADGTELARQLEALPTLSRVESPTFVGIELMVYEGD